MKRPLLISFFILISLACASQGVTQPTPTLAPIDRLASIPANISKMTPTEDAWPPVIATGWSQPEPLGMPINTPGGEDSPFIPTDGNAFYFFFTPDVRIPAEKQLLDGVTGIWMAPRLGEGWGEPVRVKLAYQDELHLDGCTFVLDDWMLFCTIRESTAGEIKWYNARRIDDHWTNWEDWSDHFDPSYQVGELHISADGQELYFGSERPGGYGGFDIWMSMKTTDGWGEPINLGPSINTEGDENRPFLTADGAELWFDATTRTGEYYPGPAVFRSKRQPDGSWGPAEEIVSQFAGEPTLSPDGNTLYFVHHYYDAELQQMLEADIYVAYRTEP